MYGRLLLGRKEYDASNGRTFVDESIKLGEKSYAFNFDLRRPQVNDIVVMRVNDDPNSSKYDKEWADNYPFFIGQIGHECESGEFVIYYFERHQHKKSEPWWTPNADGTPLTPQQKLAQALKWRWVEMERFDIEGHYNTLAIDRENVICYMPVNEQVEDREAGGKQNVGRGTGKSIRRAQARALKELNGLPMPQYRSDAGTTSSKIDYRDVLFDIILFVLFEQGDEDSCKRIYHPHSAGNALCRGAGPKRVACDERDGQNAPRRLLSPAKNTKVYRSKLQTVLRRGITKRI